MNLPEEILKARTRRQFFKDCGTGVGKIALATMLGESVASATGVGRSADAEGAALRAEGEERHLPAHGGVAVDDRPVRPQAEAQRAERPGVPRVVHPGPAVRVHQGDAEAAGLAAQVRQARASRARRCRRSCRTWRRSPTRSRSSGRCTPTSSTTPRRSSSCTPARRGWGGRAWGRGSRTGSGPRTGTCPASSSSSRGPPRPTAATSLWGSGFLPTIHQGVQLRSQGDPVLFLSNPAGMTAAQRRRSIDAIQALNQLHLDAVGDPEIVTRIAQYEMAYRMQTCVPELMDIASEPATSTSCTAPSPARRRSPTTACSPAGWSRAASGSSSSTTGAGTSTAPTKANDIRYGLVNRCQETDRPDRRPDQGPQAARAARRDAGRLGRRVRPDPDERGAERLEVARPRPQPARLHDLDGRRRRQARASAYGATDDLGYHAVEDRVHVHDLQATILHLMGLDHTRLTYRFQGRDFRLTDVSGNVVKQAPGLTRGPSPASRRGYRGSERRPLRVAVNGKVIGLVGGLSFVWATAKPDVPRASRSRRR